MIEPTRGLRLHGSWIAPPAVAGATPKPYPAHVTEQGRWLDFEADLAHATAARLRARVPPLPIGSAIEVGLRGLPPAVFRRAGDSPWDVDDYGAAVLAAHVERTHFALAVVTRISGVEWKLKAFLRQILRAHNWFAPEAPPSLTAALSDFFTQAYIGMEPDPDPIYPGERAHAAVISQRYYDDPYEPWRSRSSRHLVELMIAASGRVTPHRLRPLVLTKSNAAKKEWHYGAWGVYDTLPSGEIGALLGIYGRSAVGQENTWHNVLWDENRFPRSVPNVPGLEIAWYGLHLERQYSLHGFSEIRCAMTGSLLANWSATPKSYERPPEAFLPAEVTMPPLGEDDVLRDVRMGVAQRTEA